MLVTELAVLMAGSGGAGGGGPSGDHTSVGLTKPASTILLSWTNGDATAITEIGTTGSAGGDGPTSVLTNVAAGETSYDTGHEGTIGAPSIGTYWWVRHRKNGQYSSWVRSGEGAYDA